jgi:hypothetical protein
MRQTLPIVPIVIAAILVVGVKVVAPKPGSPRSYLTSVKVAVPTAPLIFGLGKYAMSASGPKRTSVIALHMSAFGDKADMRVCIAHVCF